MRNVFDQIVDSEKSLSSRLDSLGGDSSSYYLNFLPKHSSLCDTYSYMLVNRTLGDGSFYDLNIDDYNFSYLVNPHGIVKIGPKIYQFTSQYIKTIDDGDSQKIPNLLNATVSDPNNNITVKTIHVDYIVLHKEATTSTFVRSAVGNNGRNRVIIYQNWDQITTSQAYVMITTYKVRVRSLKKRMFGAWYDNDKRNLSISGNVTGNITYGKLANNSFITVSWSFGVSNFANNVHTWDYFLPNMYGMNQTALKELVTDGYHPEIYSSTLQGQAGNASATTTF